MPSSEKSPFTETIESDSTFFSEQQEKEQEGIMEKSQYFGEIVLCPSRISRSYYHSSHNANVTNLFRTNIGMGNWALKHRICTLLAHHLLHLLGYDHHLSKDFQEMRLQERFLLNHLYQNPTSK